MSRDLTAAELVERVRSGAARGLTLAAIHVQGVAVPRTPVEYGDLRSSLTVVPADADDLAAAIVSDLPYAVRQHEDLSLRHDDGGPKYLEGPTLAEADTVEKIVATAAVRALRGEA